MVLSVLLLSSCDVENEQPQENVQENSLSEADVDCEQCSGMTCDTCESTSICSEVCGCEEQCDPDLEFE